MTRAEQIEIRKMVEDNENVAVGFKHVDTGRKSLLVTELQSDKEVVIGTIYQQVEAGAKIVATMKREIKRGDDKGKVQFIIELEGILKNNF